MQRRHERERHVPRRLCGCAGAASRRRAGARASAPPQCGQGGSLAAAPPRRAARQPSARAPAVRPARVRSPPASPVPQGGRAVGDRTRCGRQLRPRARRGGQRRRRVGPRTACRCGRGARHEHAEAERDWSRPPGERSKRLPQQRSRETRMHRCPPMRACHEGSPGAVRCQRGVRRVAPPHPGRPPTPRASPHSRRRVSSGTRRVLRPRRLTVRRGRARCAGRPHGSRGLGAGRPHGLHGVGAGFPQRSPRPGAARS